MKTNKLPESAGTDSQAAGFQSQQISINTRHLSGDKMKQTGSASNDANDVDEDSHYHVEGWPSKDNYSAYKCFDNSLIKAQESIMTKDTNIITTTITTIKNDDLDKPSIASGYKKMNKTADVAPFMTQLPAAYIEKLQSDFERDLAEQDSVEQDSFKQSNAKPDDNIPPSVTVIPNMSSTEIPERFFMNGLIKHTAIALAIIIPLAAFSAYAAPQATPAGTTNTATTNKTTTNKTTTAATLAVTPSAIIHKSATVPTTVDSVDLEQYAGTWYEIGRLPMYFQRNCARDVTATYTGKTDGSGITVLNECIGKDGAAISAEGLAKVVDNTGSKLKVTFLPAWIRWLPVGRADYWVLARDANYQTALVGTPDNKYLWLLARSPNITQQTYAKYREIAQQQGYDLKKFKLTTQTKQTINLAP
ncbi:apolipoprotein D and lipocalin family protein [Psychrobacter sp. PL15]|uniref:lipocalin family protein n=1 Tax=unclassified Psychrobacter TaxID=196806 RepID=UPI001AE22A94|nr:lipocalin family protein [Psychrobacter sp. PL15]MEC5210144.1 apolipoprotein D and lipocalin family protein [Psychrobacter sp. PL15]